MYLFHKTIITRKYLFHKTIGKNTYLFHMTVIKNVPISQDYQPRYTQRKSVKPTSTQHHHHSKGPNQQPDMTVSHPITEPQPEITIDQLLQYLITINGNSTIWPPLAVSQVTSTPATPSSTTNEQPSVCSSPVSPRYK